MKIITIGEKFNTKFIFRETCFGICVKNGQILLTQKIDKNEISLPGGGIETNETFEDCLKREFAEETGCGINSIQELIAVDCFWLAGGKWQMESFANFFIVEINEKTFLPTEEYCKPFWTNLTEALEKLPLPYQKEALLYYLKRLK